MHSWYAYMYCTISPVHSLIIFYAEFINLGDTIINLSRYFCFVGDIIQVACQLSCSIDCIVTASTAVLGACSTHSLFYTLLVSFSCAS